MNLRVTILTVGVLATLLAPLPASAQVLFPDGENLCLDFACRECWCAGSRQEDENGKLTELIRPHESLEKWSELINLVGSETRRFDQDPETLAEWALQSLVQTSQRGCEKGFEVALASREPLGGYAARIIVVRCRSLAARPNLAESAWGTSETQVHLLVVGDERLLFADRIARRWTYDATIDEWIEFMKRARVCRRPLEIRECG